MSRRHLLVTGAAGGIGYAVAARFAASGDSVTGVDVRYDVLERFPEEIDVTGALP